jgi:hypothetical protein
MKHLARPLASHLSMGLAAFTALALANTQAHAANLQNGQFSQGLSGWQTAGDASVHNTSVLGTNLGASPALILGTASTVFDDDAPAAAGSYNASGLDPLETSPANGLEAALGLPQGAMGVDAYEGSGAQQSFTVAAGDEISFDWRLLSRNNGTASTEPDTAWLIWTEGSVSHLIKLGDIGSLAMQTGAAGWLDSGVLHHSFTSSFSGQVTVGFGVADIGSFGNTSLLAIQNVSLTAAVPEPESMALALVGLILLGRTARRTGTPDRVASPPGSGDAHVNPAHTTP